MANKTLNDGRIGKEVDWSLVVSSITRPVWEPPALEVLDRFEEFLEHGDIQDSLNLNNSWLISEYPDVGLRSRYIDVVCEGVALSRHLKWAEETHTAAMTAGDQQKTEFYKGLMEALTFDQGQLLNEHVSIWQLRVPRTSTFKVSAGEDVLAHSNTDREVLHANEGEDCDDDDENVSDSSSTTSYATAADGVSIHSIEDHVGLIDLEPLSIANTVI